MIHPPGDLGFARNADGIALILIAESAKQVIKLVIHLGNPGLEAYTAPHPLPWANFFIDRGRALAAWGRGSHDPEGRARLEGLLELGREVGFAVSTPAIEQALAAKS